MAADGERWAVPTGLKGRGPVNASRRAVRQADVRGLVEEGEVSGKSGETVMSPSLWRHVTRSRGSKTSSGHMVRSRTKKQSTDGEGSKPPTR